MSKTTKDSKNVKVMRKGKVVKPMPRKEKGGHTNLLKSTEGEEDAS